MKRARQMKTIDAQPKRSAAIFVVITCLLSWAFIWIVHAGLRMTPGVFPLVLMWIPGVVSITMRLAFHEGFADAGFRTGAPRYWLWAYAGPLALGTATYLMAALLQQVHLTPYLKQQSMMGLPFRLAWWNADLGSAGLLAQRFLVTSTLGVAIGFVYGLGEEIGWRGYLLPKLIQGGARYPILISGLVWAIWHAPFVLLFYERHPVANALLYALACLTFGVFISWLRLVSGSVIIAALAHSAYNTFLQEFYDYSFVGPNKWFWAGDVGLLCGLSCGALALWLYRTRRMPVGA